MESERSVAVPTWAAVGLLVAAVLLRGSWLGALLALAAMVPAGYVTWLGTQAKTQTRMLVGLLLLLAGLAATILIAIGRVVGWFV